MRHLRQFTAPPSLTTNDMMILARQVAMDLIPRAEICGYLDLTLRDLERLEIEDGFADMVKVEKRRLLTLEGQRDLAEWKQALVEHKYWDRLATIALAETTSPTTVVDAMKAIRRPPARDAGPGGAGGPVFAVNITIPGSDPVRISATPVIDGEAAE